MRKGKFSADKAVNAGGSLMSENGIKGQGIKSPARQLAEQLGIHRDTMNKQFKEWAAQTGYEGPMSSVEGEDIKALAKFCAEYEAEKARKAEKAKDDKADKAAKEKAKVSNLEKAVFKDLERFEVGDGPGAPEGNANAAKNNSSKERKGRIEYVGKLGPNTAARRSARLKRDHPDIYQKLI